MMNSYQATAVATGIYVVSYSYTIKKYAQPQNWLPCIAVASDNCFVVNNYARAKWPRHWKPLDGQLQHHAITKFLANLYTYS